MSSLYSWVALRGLPLPFYPELRMGRPCPFTLMRIWQRVRPDVVHVATQGPLGWSAVFAARRLDIPVVSEFRTQFDAYCGHYRIGWLISMARRYLRHFHNSTAKTLVPTLGLSRELERHGYARVSVVARGVDTELFHPQYRCEQLRRSWLGDRQAPVVLYVGRLASEKNLGLASRALEVMRRINPDTCMVWVGDGPRRAALQRAHPNTVFAGVRRGQDLAMHYASADLFLFPSLTETFGNVTLEAMASGLPIVAFDYAAAGEWVVPDRNGWLAAPGDEERYLRLVESAIREPHRLRQLGTEARSTAEGLGWDAILRRMEQHYREVCSGTAFGLRSCMAKMPS